MPLSNTASLLTTLIMIVLAFLLKYDDRKEKEMFRLKPRGAGGIVGTLFGIFLLSALIIVRYNKIERDLTSSLVDDVDAREIKAELLGELVADSAQMKPTLVLMLKNPSCDQCLEELTFWNSPDISERLNIVAFFREAPEEVIPSETLKEQLQRTFKLLRLTFKFETIERGMYDRICGKHPPLVSRFFFSAKGKPLNGWIGAEGRLNRTEVIKAIDHLSIEN